MALALDIMKGGMAAGQAKAVNGQANVTISAAGTTQGTGTALTASVNVITTAAASSGVVLPACEIGDSIDILNLGANPVTIYPDSNAQVNALAANVGFFLAPNTAVRLKRFTSTRWMGFLSA